MSVTVITPETVNPTFSGLRLFLGGSIEQGKAADWQADVVEYIDHNSYDQTVTIFNPRRKNWDPSLPNTIESETFACQVNFELDSIILADAVLIHFEEDTLSPISLLEFGFLAGGNYHGDLNKTVVSCGKKFWRRGNLEVMCDRFKIPLFESLSDALIELRHVAHRNYGRRVTFESSARS
jgi:hypothetical protein